MTDRLLHISEIAKKLYGLTCGFIIHFFRGKRICNLPLIKPNASEIKVSFLHLYLSILNGLISFKIYDNLDKTDLDILIFPFLNGDVFRSISYGVTFGLLECLFM